MLCCLIDFILLLQIVNVNLVVYFFFDLYANILTKSCYNTTYITLLIQFPADYLLKVIFTG